MLKSRNSKSSGSLGALFLKYKIFNWRRLLIVPDCIKKPVILCQINCKRVEKISLGISNLCVLWFITVELFVGAVAHATWGRAASFSVSFLIRSNSSHVMLKALDAGGWRAGAAPAEVPNGLKKDISIRN